MSYDNVQHTHEDPNGSVIRHAHPVGADNRHEGDTYDPASHYHLIIVGERNFVNWYTAPARDWPREVAS